MAHPTGPRKMVQMLKPGGPKSIRMVKGETDKRAKTVKLIKWPIGKTDRCENCKMLKRTGPQIDSNGKYDKPTRALIWLNW